jgi:heptosyltransferase-2
MNASLVIQTSFLGDTVLTTPLIAELAKRGPVDVVTRPASAGLLANHPCVRSVIPYDKRGKDSGVRGFFKLASSLRRFGYDSAYLAQASMRSAALAVAAGIPNRIGFSTAPGRVLYTKRIEFREDYHHALRLLSLATPPETTKASAARPRLYPGIAERGAVDRLLALHGALAGDPLVALAPATVWATKRWPYYSELARELAPRAHIVILGSQDDIQLANDVCAAARENGGVAINAAGILSLLASAELIRRCNVLVTNDSAPQHLASAVDTPTLTIFGPTAPTFGFGPLAPRSTTVGLETLACRPCDRHGPQKCPLGHWRCMREIAPRDVAARVVDILSLSPSST